MNEYIYDIYVKDLSREPIKDYEYVGMDIIQDTSALSVLERLKNIQNKWNKEGESKYIRYSIRNLRKL